MLFDNEINRKKISEAAAATVEEKKLKIQDLAAKYEELYMSLV